MTSDALAVQFYFDYFVIDSPSITQETNCTTSAFFMEQNKVKEE